MECVLGKRFVAHRVGGTVGTLQIVNKHHPSRSEAMTRTSE